MLASFSKGINSLLSGLVKMPLILGWEKRCCNDSVLLQQLLLSLFLLQGVWKARTKKTCNKIYGIKVFLVNMLKALGQSPIQRICLIAKIGLSKPEQFALAVSPCWNIVENFANDDGISSSQSKQMTSSTCPGWGKAAVLQPVLMASRCSQTKKRKNGLQGSPGLRPGSFDWSSLG